MTGIIGFRSQVPSYRQLADMLRGDIAAGKYGPPGEPIPSLNMLCIRTGLARSTVQRALAVLKEEGAVYSVSGRGTFVSPR